MSRLNDGGRVAPAELLVAYPARLRGCLILRLLLFVLLLLPR